MRRKKGDIQQAICAWSQAHSVNVADGEVVDLVRRLQALDIVAGCDAEEIERMTTDMIHLAADRIEGDSAKAEQLRTLAAHISNTFVAVGLTAAARCFIPDDDRGLGCTDDLVVQDNAMDDGEPGSAVGESSGTPLRYDAIYDGKPAVVMLNGKRATAWWPPSFGRVKLKPDGSHRSLVVALDELDDEDRMILRSTPSRRRTEVIIRCSVQHCTQSYRAWLREDFPTYEHHIEDTQGRAINQPACLFAAKCARHRMPS